MEELGDKELQNLVGDEPIGPLKRTAKHPPPNENTPFKPDMWNETEGGSFGEATLSEDYFENCANSAQVVWPLLAGNILEWYEFGIFGYLEDEITANFFSASWITWAFYAMAFLLRPVGGMLYGMLGDRVGRKKATLYAVIGMTAATVLQGCLPSKKTGGAIAQNVGAVLLFFCRVVQGLCVGGEVAGVHTYLSEGAFKPGLGVSVSLISLTNSGASFLAAAAVVLCTLVAGDHAMEQWAWRVCFWACLLPSFFCIRQMMLMPETEVFKAAVRQRQSSLPSGPVKDQGSAMEEIQLSAGTSWDDTKYVLCNHWKQIGLVVLSLAGVSAMWYTASPYSISYVDDHGGSDNAATAAVMLAHLMVLCLCIPVGLLTDKFGVGKVLLVGSVVLVVTAIPCISLLSAHATDTLSVYLIISLMMPLMLALSGSTVQLYVTEMFPIDVRYTAVGISYNLAVGLFGGLSPLYCETFSGTIDLFPGYYVATLSIVSFCTLLCCRHLRNRGDLKTTHIRHFPY